TEHETARTGLGEAPPQRRGRRALPARALTHRAAPPGRLRASASSGAFSPRSDVPAARSLHGWKRVLALYGSGLDFEPGPPPPEITSAAVASSMPRGQRRFNGSATL